MEPSHILLFFRKGLLIDATTRNVSRNMHILGHLCFKTSHKIVIFRWFCLNVQIFLTQSIHLCTARTERQKKNPRFQNHVQRTLLALLCQKSYFALMVLLLLYSCFIQISAERSEVRVSTAVTNYKLHIGLKVEFQRFIKRLILYQYLMINNNNYYISEPN